MENTGYRKISMSTMTRSLKFLGIIMKVLLDTHIALWAVLKTDSLSQAAKDILLSEDNEVFYSVISLWEVSLKHMINPRNMEVSAVEFRHLCQESGFIEIPQLIKLFRRG